jgi:hypothetical protein
MIAGAGVGVVAATTGSAAQQGRATQTEVVTEYVIEEVLVPSKPVAAESPASVVITTPAPVIEPTYEIEAEEYEEHEDDDDY